MISALGAIHCITKEIGVAEPVFISHAKLLNTSNTTIPYEVKAFIKTKSGVASAKVYWRTDTTQSYAQLSMSNSQDTFRAYIPPQASGKDVYYYISATSNSGITSAKPLTAPGGYLKFHTNNPVINISIRVAPEGLYDSTSNKLMRRDTVLAYLRNSVAPYAVVDSARSVVDSVTRECQFTFSNASTGRFYIVVKHYQCLETWSKAGGDSLFANGLMQTYDFTSSATQAFGSNMKRKGTSYCLIAGDANQDGIVDGSDLLLIDNDLFNYLAQRFAVTDLNGDGYTDGGDMLIADNNAGSERIAP
jgi:hypothetical protein